MQTHLQFGVGELANTAWKATEANFNELYANAGVYPAGAPSTTGVDDAVALNAAAAAAFAAGGGIVQMGRGKYIVATPVIIYPLVSYRGMGREATIVALKGSSNCDVFQGQNFGSLTGTNSAAGIYNFELRDFTVDGNRGGQQSAGYGIRFFGYNYFVQNVVTRQCYIDGWWSEWGNVSTPSPNRVDLMEGGVYYVKSHDNNGTGFTFVGAHDSEHHGLLSITNGSYGFWTKGNGFSRLVSCHGWGASEGPIFQLDAGGHLANCYADGGNSDGFVINSGGAILTGCVGNQNAGAAFRCTASASNPQIQGSVFSSAIGLQIDSGAFGVKADLNVVSPTTNTLKFNGTDTGGWHSLSIRGGQASGTGVSGTPATTCALDINIQGGASGSVLQNAAGQPQARRATTTSINNGASYTPDFSKYNYFEISINGATATINDPTFGPTSPQRCTLRIFNNSGGATTITFGTHWHLGTFVQPGAGKVRTLDVEVGTNNADAYLIGQESADL